MPETGRKAVNARLVVVVVVVSAGPQGEPVPQRPREIVARVRIDSLEETERNPHVDSGDVQVLAEETVQEGAHDGALGENEDFEGVGVLGGL